MTFSRLETSKSRLNIDWTTAGWVDEQASTEARVLQSITRYDQRPVLLVRRGKLDEKAQKLLDQALASERFQLASQWFQCIQVDEKVLAKDHDLYPLFSGRRPAVMLLATPDGKRIERFLGTVQQKVNWPDIAAVLKTSYVKDPTKAVKGLERLLSKFDALDNREKELNEQIGRCDKDEARKIKALQDKLAELAAERKKVVAEEQELRKLVLRCEAKAEKEAAEKEATEKEATEKKEAAEKEAAEKEAAENGRKTGV